MFPQIKFGGWLFYSWFGLSENINNHILSTNFTNYCKNFDTLEEAVEMLRKYEEQKGDDGKVVWKNY
jgi:hypothetical protein